MQAILSTAALLCLLAGAPGAQEQRTPDKAKSGIRQGSTRRGVAVHGGSAGYGAHRTCYCPPGLRPSAAAASAFKDVEFACAPSACVRYSNSPHRRWSPATRFSFSKTPIRACYWDIVPVETGPCQ